MKILAVEDDLVTGNLLTSAHPIIGNFGSAIGDSYSSRRYLL